VLVARLTAFLFDVAWSLLYCLGGCVGFCVLSWCCGWVMLGVVGWVGLGLGSWCGGWVVLVIEWVQGTCRPLGNMHVL
jgi:hypothetical protein